MDVSPSSRDEKGVGFLENEVDKDWCWRRKKLVGLVDLQLREASPHKTMEQSRFNNQEWRQEWRNWGGGEEEDELDLVWC
jgi:hypothetical protein